MQNDWLKTSLTALLSFYYVTTQTTALFGLLKTVRLLRLVRVSRQLDLYFEYRIALLLLLMFGFTLMAHWFACIWYAIGVYENPTKNSLSWLAKLRNDVDKGFNATSTSSDLDLQTIYLTALYFTLSSMTSVGFGNVSANTNGEKLFTILVMIVGGK